MPHSAGACRMYSRQQFRMVLVLILCFKEDLIMGISTTQLLPSTAGTWSNHEDNCEDSSCVTCKQGFYGEGSCNMTCNQHCMLGYCNSSTGACKYGCVNTSNYSLTSPWYGPSCSESCISNCFLGRCFRDGTCYLGCKNGTFGEKCEDACPKNCNHKCKMIGGECDDGCKSGFYGKYCNGSCSMNCLGERCQQNGTCYNCTVGFQGDTCRKTCPKQCTSCLQYGDNCTGCKDGRYGHKCIVCDNCKGKCRFSDGGCTDGCKEGYYGDHCNVSCSSGCQSSVCDQSTGECSLGCTPTMYGRSCDQNCSRTCMEGQCRNRSGMECSIGCRAGFWGQYCERPCGGACLRCNRSSGSCMDCTKGTYGRHCEKNCSVNCSERKCNISGACVSGCISSYRGNNCSFTCSKHCSTCDQMSGTCNRCVPGWTGDNCKESTRTAVFHTLVTVLMMAVGFLVCYLIYASVCYITRQVRENEEGQLLQCCLKWFSKRRTSADSFDPINKEFGVNSDFYYGSKRLTLYDGKNNILPCLTQKEFLALDKSSNQGNSVKPCTLNNDTTTSHHHTCATNGRTVSQCRLDHQQRSRGQQREHMATSKEGRDRSRTSDGRDVSDQSRSSIGCSRTGQNNYEDARYANVNHIRRKDSDKSISIPRFRVYYDHQRGGSETFRSPGGLELVRDDCKNETLEGEAKTPACGGKVGMGTPRLETTAVDWRYFMEYLHGMRLHDGFIQQFEELPKGELAMCVDAKRPVNLSQNRFKNMHPYDHCRVILRNSDRASDYINASHINGYGKSGFFIATQGPLQETTADFWNMVLQYEVTAIIMLTNIFENDRLKCVKYWPDVGAARQYGGCCVQTVQEESEMDYTVRTLSIAQGGGHGHQICQYHFTAWPDHGQPSCSQSLLDFYNHAQTTFGDGPIIVHCSAGIGRTGTFIALDYLIDQAIAEGVVDVFQCVKRLRYQRMNMVQTLGQYEFLHEVLGLAFLQLSLDYHNG